MLFLQKIMSQFQVEGSHCECLEKFRSLVIASGGHFHPDRTSRLYGWFLGNHLKEKNDCRVRVTLNCLMDATLASVY